MAVLTPEEVKQLPCSLRVLEIGCGQIKRVPFSTTLDLNTRSLANVIHDLNVFPYPFEDDSFDMVIAEHVLEHVDDLVRVVEELHRILAPGGLLLVEVPHFSSYHFFTDPTHRHAFSTRSFDYFMPDTELGKFQYSTLAWKKRKVTISYGGHNWVTRFLGDWINRHQLLYEHRFAFIFPKENLNFELEAVK